MSKKEEAGLDSPAEVSIRLHSDGTLTINDAAKVLGVSSMTIREWIKKGMPVAFSGEGKKGVAARVLFRDILDFKVSGADSLRFENEDGEIYELEYEKARRAHMLADLEEMRRDRERGRIVLIEDVLSVIEEEYGLLRAGVMGIPSRCVVKLSGLTDQREIYNYLREQILDVLTELSDARSVASRSVSKVTDEDPASTLNAEEEGDL